MRIRTALVIDPGGGLGPGAQTELETAGIRVTSTVGYGLEALNAAFEQKPDLTLIRAASPLARPLQIISAIHDALPDSAILAVVDASIGPAWTKVIAAGATVCVDAGARPEVLKRGLSASNEFFLRHQGAVLDPVLGGRIIAVLGAKGGVGKTTVATNLAVALQHASLGSVALVDADPACGDIALAMNLDFSRTLADAAANLSKENPEDIRRLLTSKAGVSILSGPTTAKDIRGVTANQVTDVLVQLRDIFDFVVVDTSGAWSDLTAAVVDASTTRLLVSTPEPNSAKDTGRVLRWLREQLGDAAERVHVVENRAGMAGALDERQFLREVGQAPTWRVANDPKLMRAMQAGVPAVDLYPRATGSRDLARIATSLLDRPQFRQAQSSPPVRLVAPGVAELALTP